MSSVDLKHVIMLRNVAWPPCGPPVSTFSLWRHNAKTPPTRKLHFKGAASKFEFAHGLATPPRITSDWSVHTSQDKTPSHFRNPRTQHPGSTYITMQTRSAGFSSPLQARAWITLCKLMKGLERIGKRYDTVPLSHHKYFFFVILEM